MNLVVGSICPHCNAEGQLYLEKNEYGDLEVKCRLCSRMAKNNEEIKKLIAERNKHGSTNTAFHRMPHPSQLKQKYTLGRGK